MLLQYGLNDLNRDNPHFSERACLWQNEADYPEGADRSDWEARSKKSVSCRDDAMRNPTFSLNQKYI